MYWSGHWPQWSVPRPQPGETWQFALQFAAHGSGGHARRGRALLRDGVSIEARSAQVAAQPAAWSRRRSLLATRQRVASRIDERVADPSAAALLAALAVGVTGRSEQAAMAGIQRHRHHPSGGDFRDACDLPRDAVHGDGAAPVGSDPAPCQSVSGAKCSLAQSASSWRLAYALLSGFSVPAQRTVVMLVAFLCARECCPRLWRPAGASRQRCGRAVVRPAGGTERRILAVIPGVASIILLAGARLHRAGRCVPRRPCR